MKDRLNLELEVQGAYPIVFEEGWSCGIEKEGGIEIEGLQTDRAIGGVITRKDALKLRNFLNECLVKWKMDK